MALLSNQLLRQLEQLQLLARRRSKSSARGERRSGAKGQSVEFADHRHYSPGDDPRRIDWNLYGRLDRLFLKLYEEERELPVTLHLDSSESMTFGKQEKFTFARQVAAAVGYVALCGFDRVSVLPFPEQNGEQAVIRAALRMIRGRKSSIRFFQHLNQLQGGGPADFNESIRLGALKNSAPGVSIVLSDFLDPRGYEEGLKTLCNRGSQAHVVQILSPEELEPPIYGDLKLIDAETGTEQEVTFGKFRLKAYQKTVQNYCQRLREFCQKRGIHYLLARSDTPLEDLLLKSLREGGMWK